MLLYDDLDIAAILKNSLLSAMSFGGTQTWVWVAVLFSSSVTLGKLLNFSKLIFLPVKMGMKILYYSDAWIREKLSNLPNE